MASKNTLEHSLLRLSKYSLAGVEKKGQLEYMWNSKTKSVKSTWKRSAPAVSV